MFGEAEAFELFKNDCINILQRIDEEVLINKPLGSAKQYLIDTFPDMY